MIVIDKNKLGENVGQAWFQSVHRDCIIELIKLHKKVWSSHVLRTFLMGFPYDDERAEDEDDDFKIDKEYLKGGQFEKEDLEEIVYAYTGDYDENDLKDEDELADQVGESPSAGIAPVTMPGAEETKSKPQPVEEQKTAGQDDEEDGATVSKIKRG